LGLGRSIIILKRLTEEIIENSSDGLLRRTLRYLENRRVQIKKKQTVSVEIRNDASNGIPAFQDDLADLRLPWFSRAILRTSPLNEIVAARQRNYRLLDEQLGVNAYLRKILPPLPDNVCPWAYPVWVRNRAKYDYQLRKLGIPVFTFGEVLHPLVYECEAGLVGSADALSKSLMMIPVHQNLSEQKILCWCELIREFFVNLVTSDQSQSRWMKSSSESRLRD
jgi:hypothetical protein